MSEFPQDVLDRALEWNEEIIPECSYHTYAVIYGNLESAWRERECYGMLMGETNTDTHPILAIADASFSGCVKKVHEPFLTWLWNESMFAPLFLVKEFEQYKTQGQVMDAVNYRAMAIVAALFSQRLGTMGNFSMWQIALNMGFSKHQALVLMQVIQSSRGIIHCQHWHGALDWFLKGTSIKQLLAYWDEQRNTSMWHYTRPRSGFDWKGTSQLFAPAGNELRASRLFEPLINEQYSVPIKTSWGETRVLGFPIEGFSNAMFSYIEKLRETPNG